MMEKKYGFLKMDGGEFKQWISNLPINRSVFFIQQHHTYRPGYASFKGNNHFELQRNMKNYHVGNNGWSDIGQHFSIFPDGTIVTGRSLERSPACIYGKNSNAICFESIGNFDTGGDEMNDTQKNAIVEYTAALCKRFGIIPGIYTILYHHWFKLSTGERNNGAGGNKSCPGSNFFGGNKIEDFEANFLPLLKKLTGGDDKNLIDDFDKLVCVKANRLNIRTGAGSNNSLAKGIKSVKFGTVLKSFREENGWNKINASEEYWVSGRYVRDVFAGVVTANVLNVRSGAGANNSIVDKVMKGQQLILELEQNGWYKINLEDKWVSKSYVELK